MKVFIPGSNWIGNWVEFLKNAFQRNSIEVLSNYKNFKLNSYIQLLKLNQIVKVKSWDIKQALYKYNSHVLNSCIQAKPDIFLVMNEGKLFPSTIQKIKESCKCLMVCVIADYPWDSTRFIADFPHSLKFFDIIFVSDPIWNINIKQVAPKAKLFWNYGGYDTNYFYPLTQNEISEQDKKLYSGELSFTGSNYGEKAEGAYRADILANVTDFDLQIWGDDNWPYRFKYLPQLKKAFKGDRLPYSDLRKLYSLSKINLNLPAPQILTAFQPRVFEIAACKGFQLADDRPLFKKLFASDELVTFNNPFDLREKINFFLNNAKERKKYVEKLYAKVTQNYTWELWAKKTIDIIQYPDQFEKL